ncbi:hypothetical protein EDD90_7180 [Streptomyces sp. Ag109_O5-1]|uniref:hypothetical protein n=1 Tax=Streptomyces sp. Ag109_O5-1 TaxID=1938851 RepID=UPI000F50670C|nr:hypothetical protein [Streptomyces sp. Ag109_O5-1]RPE43959.1 hypothetical protein EDD90_7180 [Streptomyces sp. Ag109_O5-1]
MILVPGRLWRWGPVGRAVGAGLGAGVLFGAFVLVESAAWAGAGVVFVVLGVYYGIRVARRMDRLWPAARGMKGADRAAVVRAARGGGTVADPRLMPVVVEYAGALHRAAEEDRQRRWVVVSVTVFAAALAVHDTLTGSIGETVASWLVVALFLGDLLWWPRSRARLLARADRAAASARRATDAGRPADGP